MDLFSHKVRFIVFCALTIIIVWLSAFFSFEAQAQAVNVTATVPTSTCSNGLINSGEQCDGSDLGGKSCTDLGFTGGTLSCNVSCGFNSSGCTSNAEVTAAPLFSSSVGGNYELVNTNNSVEITLPENFYPQNLRLQMFSYNQSVFESSKPAPLGKNFVGKTYDFVFIDPNGNTVSTLSQPAVLTIVYTEADVSGIDQSTLAPYHRESGDSSWQLITGATVDASNHKITFSTAAFSSFAIFASPSSPSTPPSSGGGGGGGGIYSVLTNFVLKLIPGISQDYNKAQQSDRALQLTDFNGDGSVNIVDLSILLYYFDKPVTNLTSQYDLNDDRKINITDISILLYYWR